MEKREVKGILFRFFVVFFVIIFIFIFPCFNFNFFNENSVIYSTFLGKKSSFCGIIEVWNIDTFESGYQSKSVYLEKQALKFKKQNKGINILIRNLTENECVNMLQNGNYPSLISCSYGVSKKIQDYCVSYETNEKIYDNYLNAGKGEDGSVYGLAWCTGFYCLISTKEKLQKAGKDIENISLNELIDSSSYNYKIWKNEKTSKSLVYGTNNYLMPEQAINEYNKARSIQTNLTLENELILKSQYSAYVSFLSNDATILLGTQRDIVRMENRVQKGNISDVVYLPVLDWTDLIQFIFKIECNDKNKEKYAEKFANFLVKQENQKEIQSVGLFPVTHIDYDDYKGVMLDIILDNYALCELKNVFQ